MESSLPLISLIIILIILEAVSQYNLKLFSQSNTIHNFVFAIIIYILIALGLSYLFSIEKMGIVNHMWNVGTSILVILVGYMFFNEDVNTKQGIGFIFGLIGMVLMASGGKIL